jgi:hypothetical protein
LTPIDALDAAIGLLEAIASGHVRTPADCLECLAALKKARVNIARLKKKLHDGERKSGCYLPPYGPSGVTEHPFAWFGLANGELSTRYRQSAKLARLLLSVV